MKKLLTKIKAAFALLKVRIQDNQLPDEDPGYTGNKYLIAFSLAFGIFLGIPTAVAILVLLFARDLAQSDLYSFYVQAFFVVLVVLFFFKKYIYYAKRMTWKNALVGIRYGLYSFLVAQTVLIIYHFLGYPYIIFSDATDKQMFLQYAWVYFFFLVVAAPIIEEFAFRYVFFKHFAKHNFFGAFIIASVVFALAHFTNQIMLGVDLLRLIVLPVYLFGAFALTTAFYKTRNIFTSMITHALYNFLIWTTMIMVAVAV